MLARIRKSMDEKDQGFTLIELLVVMIIIGILAAIAIPVFLNQRKKAVDASMKSDLRTVATEEETYFTDYQAYLAVASTNTPSVNGTAVKLSKDNMAVVTLNTLNTAFCVAVSNTVDANSHNWVYVSSQGGVQAATVTTCPGAGAF